MLVVSSTFYGTKYLGWHKICFERGVNTAMWLGLEYCWKGSTRCSEITPIPTNHHHPINLASKWAPWKAPFRYHILFFYILLCKECQSPFDCGSSECFLRKLYVGGHVGPIALLLKHIRWIHDSSQVHFQVQSCGIMDGLLFNNNKKREVCAPSGLPHQVQNITTGFRYTLPEETMVPTEARTC